GKVYAKGLAAEGMKIVITDIDRVQGEKTADEINKMGYEAIFIKADVTNRSEVKVLMEKTFEQLGGLDILVNNAGIAKMELIHHMDFQNWDNVINIHLTGTFNCSYFALQHMIPKRYGKIINISSRAAMGLV